MRRAAPASSRPRRDPGPGRSLARRATGTPGAGLALAAALLLGGCATPRGTAEEPVVTSFELPGARSVDQDALRLGLATQGPDCFWLGIACDWTRLDPDALANDRRRIEAFYRTRGFYQARAEAPKVTPDGTGRAGVAVPVHEGAPLRVRRVDVSGLDVASEARPGKLPLKVGAVFTEADYDATRATLLAALHNHGYAVATVEAHALVVPEEGIAEATYAVTPGPRLRYGRAVVTGTTAVSPEFLAAQVERELPPGDWFDESRLVRAQARIFELGVFAGVRLTVGAPDAAAGTVSVQVAVREAPFRTVRFGPGLGFQATRWDTQGMASWTNRNFMGGLRKVQVDLRAGYAWLPNPIKTDRQDVVGQLGLQFSQPGVIGRIIDVAARLELERSLEQAYGFWSERLRLGTPLRIAPRWTVAPSFNLDVYQLHQVIGGSPTLLPQFSNCPSQVCLLSYLEERFAWDGRDDPITTRRGFLGSLSIQEGFPIGGFGYTYLRVLPEVRVFVPLGRTVFGVRARVGVLVPIRETGPAPVVALFTSGGAQTVRGYGAGRLSPMTNQPGSPLWVATGGNGLLDATAELRIPLRGDLGAAVFVDGGNVSAASGRPTEYRSALDPTLLQLSVGVGLRYRTPFGPLRTDVAMRLPNDLRPGVAFDHRFPEVPGGGHREPIAALQVTLGEAF